MQTDNSVILSQVINSALIDKKAENIININLTKIENSVSKFFIICTANSKIHAITLAKHIEDTAREILKEKTWHIEGIENSEWILLDYVDVVVHIFLENTRKLYRLEQLWGDADFKSIS